MSDYKKEDQRVSFSLVDFSNLVMTVQTNLHLFIEFLMKFVKKKYVTGRKANLGRPCSFWLLCIPAGSPAFY